MMKKFILISVAVALISLAPIAGVSADEHDKGLVPCTGSEPCTFDDLLGNDDSLVKRGLNFMLFYVAIPIATLSIAIAGFKFIVSGANPGEREKAKKIMWYALIGLLLAFGAWLIIDLMLDFLVGDDNRVFDPPLGE